MNCSPDYIEEIALIQLSQAQRKAMEKIMNKKFRIVPKRDFGKGPGYWLPNAGNVGTGKYGFVKSGFVVTDGLCNIMPGACWFRTVEEAMHAIKIYIEAEGVASKFWELMKEEE